MKINHIFDYQGTADRPTYWGVYIGSCLAVMLGMLISGLFALIGFAFLGYILLLITAFGIIYVSVITLIKRCRDIGISPLFSLALLIPTVNVIVLIVFGCLPSKNKH